MPQEKVIYVCPTCHGSGSHEGRTCLECKGRGELSDFIETSYQAESYVGTTIAGAGTVSGCGLSSMLGWVAAIPFICVFGIIGSQMMAVTGSVLTQLVVAFCGTIIIFAVVGAALGILFGRIFS